MSFDEMLEARIRMKENYLQVIKGLHGNKFVVKASIAAEIEFVERELDALYNLRGRHDGESEMS